MDFHYHSQFYWKFVIVIVVVFLNDNNVNIQKGNLHTACLFKWVKRSESIEKKICFNTDTFDAVTTVWK